MAIQIAEEKTIKLSFVLIETSYFDGVSKKANVLLKASCSIQNYKQTTAKYQSPLDVPVDWGNKNIHNLKTVAVILHHFI